MIQYVRDPERILQLGFDRIREQVALDSFTTDQQQVVLHMISANGDPALAQHISFSERAVDVTLRAIKRQHTILYDDGLIKAALDEYLLYQEPLTFINKAAVISEAKATRQTRAMVAVDYWRPYLRGSIILVGQAGTALFRLLEILKDTAVPRPAVVIAAAHGFVNATEAKQLLWEQHHDLGIECIVVQGTIGGGVLAATALNGLLRLQQGRRV